MFVEIFLNCVACSRTSKAYNLWGIDFDVKIYFFIFLSYKQVKSGVRILQCLLAFCLKTWNLSCFKACLKDFQMNVVKRRSKCGLQSYGVKYKTYKRKQPCLIGGAEFLMGVCSNLHVMLLTSLCPHPTSSLNALTYPHQNRQRS